MNVLQQTFIANDRKRQSAQLGGIALFLYGGAPSR
jgi:hypothetical protein